MALGAIPIVITRPPIDFLTAPFRRFARVEASGGILLFLCTIIAIAWANSTWAHGYDSLWKRTLTIGFGSVSVSYDYRHWINDGLMAIFFFLMGLEIKREILCGELSSFKSAVFPFTAALGGCVFPLGVYLLFAYGTEAQRGWAVPMATDIAFALGVLALLGRNVPPAIKIFVTALAIVDDVFSVLVIALFYTADLSLPAIGMALLGLSFSCLANWLGIRKPSVYAFIGLLVWLAVLKSGIHATIAGVLMALTIPASTTADRSQFLRSGRALLDRIEAVPPHSPEEHDAVGALESQSVLMQSPLHRIEYSIQPGVSFLIMPLFALANAGVRLLGNMSGAFTSHVSLGIAAGLFVGKPLGITLFSWLAVKWNLASTPANVSWRQILGASWLGGIGFTMSLFIAGLAFGETSLLTMAKIGTFGGSVLAGIAGAMVLKHRHTESFSEQARAA